MQAEMGLQAQNAELGAGDIKSLALFAHVDPEEVLPLLAACPIRVLPPGARLIAAGDISHCVYLLIDGCLSVRLNPDDAQAVATIEAGESVGEIALIDGQPAAADVYADVPTRVLVIDEETLWALVKASHGVACNLLRTLVQRLRYGSTVINRIQDLLREYEYEATVDSLTNLFNRRWLDKMIRRQVNRANSGHQRFSVLMIDIDHFKNYNDTHGHLAGDRALVSVARCLQELLRPEDTLSRYGGEELVALLPGTGQNDAMQVAERLREAVSTTPASLHDEGDLPPVTVSIGVAELQHGQDPEALIESADAALYRAKRAGRNRVCK
jgi:diguanylate cyclase (GGDEF)-like protein